MQIGTNVNQHEECGKASLTVGFLVIDLMLQPLSSLQEYHLPKRNGQINT